MTDELKVTSLRQYDDVIMLVDGKVREITRLRFFIGDHGPFERVFDRGVSSTEIEQAIRDQRDALQRLAQL